MINVSFLVLGIMAVVVIGLLAGFIVSNTRYREALKEIRSLRKHILEIDSIDTLTGLKTRYYFINRLKEEMARISRYKSSAGGIIICEIEGLKELNRQSGYDIGDFALKTIAEMVSKSCRGADTVSRYSDTSFAILATNTDREGLNGFVHRIETISDSGSVWLPDGSEFSCRFKIGAVSLGDVTGEQQQKSFSALLRQAEERSRRYQR